MSATTRAEARDLFGGIWSGWDGFWFSRADPATLAWVRIGCGLVAFYVTLTYSWGLLSYVGPDGFLNKDLAGEYLRSESKIWSPPTGWDGDNLHVSTGTYQWSIFLHVTDPGWIVALHVFVLLNMLLYTVGLGTRLTGAISWIGAMSYVHRTSSVTVFGLDTMIMIVLFYLQLGPAGARMSLDRLIQKWWARRGGLPEPTVEPSYAANFAVRLLQVHFCIIYLASGATKLLGSSWWSGTALNMVMLNPEFAPLNNPLYLMVMRAMARQRWLWESFMSASILFTVAVEVGFSFLVWHRKLRWAVICASVMLHVGIGVIMGLTTFSMIMLVFVSAFIPPEVIREFVDAAQRLLRGRRKAGATAEKASAGELVLSR